jgi:LPXTG-motif cell wall-anchored protein
MLKKILGFAAIVLATTVASSGVASAQDAYPPAGDTVAASDTTVEPGQPVTISARTFCAGCPVTFMLFSEPINLGTVDADANGVATITFTVPEELSAGTHTVEASGTGADGQPLTVTTTITVTGAAGGAGGGNLPTTGNDSAISMSQVALAAIVGGGLLVLVANKRRSSTPERETAGV